MFFSVFSRNPPAKVDTGHQWSPKLLPQIYPCSPRIQLISKTHIYYTHHYEAYIKSTEMSFSVFSRNPPAKVDTGHQWSPKLHPPIYPCSPRIRLFSRTVVDYIHYEKAYIKNPGIYFLILEKNAHGKGVCHLATSAYFDMLREMAFLC